MKVLATLCSAGLIALMMTACNQTPPPAPDAHEADVKAISILEAQWSKATAANNVDQALTYYADDAVLIAPGMEAAQGKDAITAAMKGMAKDPAFSLQFQTKDVDVAKSGDMGYSWGTYQLTVSNPAGKGTLTDHGSYVTVYRKRADGSWKAVEDIASSALVPTAPKKKS